MNKVQILSPKEINELTNGIIEELKTRKKIKINLFVFISWFHFFYSFPTARLSKSLITFNIL